MSVSQASQGRPQAHGRGLVDCRSCWRHRRGSPGAVNLTGCPSFRFTRSQAKSSGRRQAAAQRLDLVRSERRSGDHAQCARSTSDGTFKVVTGGSGDGAPAGEYKVRIEAPELPPDPKTKKTLFPSKYTDEDSSHIVVTVLPQENHLDPIRLEMTASVRRNVASHDAMSAGYPPPEIACSIQRQASPSGVSF